MLYLIGLEFRRPNVKRSVFSSSFSLAHMTHTEWHTLPSPLTCFHGDSGELFLAILIRASVLITAHMRVRAHTHRNTHTHYKVMNFSASTDFSVIWSNKTVGCWPTYWTAWLNLDGIIPNICQKKNWRSLLVRKKEETQSRWRRLRIYTDNNNCRYSFLGLSVQVWRN